MHIEMMSCHRFDVHWLRWVVDACQNACIHCCFTCAVLQDVLVCLVAVSGDACMHPHGYTCFSTFTCRFLLMVSQTIRIRYCFGMCVFSGVSGEF